MFNWAWQRYINEASAWKSVCDETQNLNKTESKTFPILNFLIPKPTLFSMPNFSDTESNTFLIPKPLLFQYRNRYFFYINFFDTESDTIKKIENRNVTHGNANALLKHIRVEMVCAHPWSACFQTLSLGKYSWSKIQKPGLQTFSILLLSTPTQTVMNIIYKLKKSVVLKILVRFPTFPQSSPSPFIKF